MGKTTIFLASSTKEFPEERIQFKTRLNQLNFIEGGDRFEVIRCEDESDDVQKDGSQKTYDDMIPNCDYFCVMIGKDIKMMTRHEFDIAYQASVESGKKPKTYVYFLQADSRTEAAMAFKEELRQKRKHYTNECTDIDEEILHFIIELLRNSSYEYEFVIRDDKVFINGQVLGRARDLPLYKKNKELKEKNEELERIRQHISDLRKRIAELDIETDEDSIDVLEVLISERKNEQKELSFEIQQLIEGVQESCRLIINRNLDLIDKDEEAVLELIQNGEYEEAKKNIQESLFFEEYPVNSKNSFEKMQELSRKYIAWKRMIITCIKALSPSVAESENEIKQVYEEIIEEAFRWQVSIDVVYEYARFLYRRQKQENYNHSFQVLERLNAYYTLHQETDPVRRMQCKNLMAEWCYKALRYSEAEVLFQESIMIYEAASDHKDISLGVEAARAGCHLSEVFWRRDQTQKAIDALDKAYRFMHDCTGEIKDNMDEKTLRIYGSIFENYGINYVTLLYFDEALEMDQKGKDIWERILKMPDKVFEDDYYLNQLATACNNLGFHYRRMNHYREAVRYITEAIRIREELYQKDPEAYGNAMAVCTNNLGTVYRLLGQYKEAEEQFRRAMKIREAIKRINSETMQGVYAVSLRELAVNGYLLGDEKGFRENYEMVKSMYKELMVKERAAYVKKAAITYQNEAIYYSRKGDLALAEESYKKAYEFADETYRSADAVKGKDHLYLVVGYARVEIFMNRIDKAEDLLRSVRTYYREALEISESTKVALADGMAIYACAWAELSILLDRFKEAKEYLEEAEDYLMDLIEDYPKMFTPLMEYIGKLSEGVERKMEDPETEWHFEMDCTIGQVFV